uniref:Uncharacterized protein n=1 Tax=Arundo donax TaxID=35708 RepID=A0A0A8YJK8_ARUDO
MFLHIPMKELEIFYTQHFLVSLPTYLLCWNWPVENLKLDHISCIVSL